MHMERGGVPKGKDAARSSPRRKEEKMKTLRVAVCDDNEIMGIVVRKKAEEILKEKDILVLTDVFTDGREFLAAAGRRRYDLVLLDISMPSTDGIALAGHLRERGTAGEVVFVSDREDRGTETFAVRPFAFVRKSCLEKDLAETLERFADSYFRDRMTLCVPVAGEGDVYVPYGRILYIESERHSQRIHLEGTETPLVAAATLRSLVPVLEEHDIINVHKSFCVNLWYVVRFEKTDILLKNGKRVPVGRDRVQDCRRKFMLYLEKNRNLIVLGVGETEKEE